MSMADMKEVFCRCISLDAIGVFYHETAQTVDLHRRSDRSIKRCEERRPRLRRPVFR